MRTKDRKKGIPGMKKSKMSSGRWINHKYGFVPDVRTERVLAARQELNKGKYDLNKRLDVSLDKVFEDLAR